MSTQNIIRAWKDESYRSSLSEAERAALPPNPAGVIAVSIVKPDQSIFGSTLVHCLTWIECSQLKCV